MNLEDKIPQIKMIVQNSVEGLSYDKVSVVMFEAEVNPIQRVDGPPMSEFMGIRYTNDSLDDILLWVGVGGLLLLIAIAGNVFFFIRMGKIKAAIDAATNG